MTMREIADDRDRQIASERAEAAGLLRFAAPGVRISEGGIGPVTCSSEVNVDISQCLEASSRLDKKAKPMRRASHFFWCSQPP